MNWLDRLLGRPAPTTERADDEQAIAELRDSFEEVRGRTDRLVDDYRKADQQRAARRKA